MVSQTGHFNHSIKFTLSHFAKSVCTLVDFLQMIWKLWKSESLSTIELNDVKAKVHFPVEFKSYSTLKVSFNKRLSTTLKRLKSVFSQYKKVHPLVTCRSPKIPILINGFLSFFDTNFWLRILHVFPFYCVFADSSRCDQIYMNRPFWFIHRRLGQRELLEFHFPTFSTSKLFH